MFYRDLLFKLAPAMVFKWNIRRSMEYFRECHAEVMSDLVTLAVNSGNVPSKDGTLVKPADLKVGELASVANSMLTTMREVNGKEEHQRKWDFLHLFITTVNDTLLTERARCQRITEAWRTQILALYGESYIPGTKTTKQLMDDGFIPWVSAAPDFLLVPVAMLRVLPPLTLMYPRTMVGMYNPVDMKGAFITGISVKEFMLNPVFPESDASTYLTYGVISKDAGHISIGLNIRNILN